MYICRGSIGPMLASAIPQTSLSRVDFSPKYLLLLLMTKSWMRAPPVDEGAAAGKSQLGCLLPYPSFSFWTSALDVRAHPDNSFGSPL